MSVSSNQMHQSYYREITPLSFRDSFLIFDREKDFFDFPIHYHPEMELNFISNAKGARRIIGDSIEEIDDVDLVFVGPRVVHGWVQHKCPKQNIHEITVQFHEELFSSDFLARSILKPIRDMFSRSSRGILFSKEVARTMAPRLEKVSKIDGIDYFLEMISILHDLAVSRNQRLLSMSINEVPTADTNDRLKVFYDYIQEKFKEDLTLEQVAAYMRMSVVSFSRFIKKRTGRTFVQYLHDIRIGYASRWIIEKELDIAEIAYESGFNSIAHFNRIFKKTKGRTPTQYREEFRGIRKVL